MEINEGLTVYQVFAEGMNAELRVTADKITFGDQFVTFYSDEKIIGLVDRDRFISVGRHATLKPEDVVTQEPSEKAE